MHSQQSRQPLLQLWQNRCLAGLGLLWVLAVAVIVIFVATPAVADSNTIAPVAPQLGPASNAQCPPEGCIGKPSELGIPEVGTGDAVTDAIDLLSLLAGILSVIFLVLGGIRYTTSSGDSTRVTSARQTITFAVIGLAVSLIAPLIVGFVIERGPH